MVSETEKAYIQPIPPSQMKELPVYALVVGKTGPKFTLSAQGWCSKFKASIIQGKPLVLPGISATSCEGDQTMDQLAQFLSRYTDRPVLNRTGIEGGHVYELQWAANGRDVQPAAATPSDGPSLFTAIQEQIGLRLDATKAPVEVLVIDSVSRPTEN